MPRFCLFNFLLLMVTLFFESSVDVYPALSLSYPLACVLFHFLDRLSSDSSQLCMLKMLELGRRNGG